MNTYHISVMLEEAVAALQIRSGGKYIDGTIGGGGHSAFILAKGGTILGIDQDSEALSYVKERFAKEIAAKKLVLAKGNFRNIAAIAHEHGFDAVDGILLDIGVSSHHLDTPERGFSFMQDAPLDMRMDKDLSVQAGDLLQILTKGELYDLFTQLGEERFSRTIVSRIISARKIKKIETTTELAEIIKHAVPFTKKGMHPATRVFQALRIAVNDELHSLFDALPRAIEVLKSGGRLAVISFHSLEDRIVKKAFLDFEGKGLGKIITKKPIIPTVAEIEKNNRARSSKLRIFEKI